jgi:hypothetical protein
MSSRRRTPLARHRARRMRNGYVRVEVSVHKDDAILVRGVATALSDPARERAMRRLLREGLGESSRPSLKALLAAAPIDGIDLTRSSDVGQDVEL